MTAHPSRLAGSLVGGTARHWLAPVMEMAAVASGNRPPSPEPGPLGWTCFPKVATRTPGVDAGSVRAARAFTIATLQRWGAADRTDDVAIVVSELLTNALSRRNPAPVAGPARPAAARAMRAVRGRRPQPAAPGAERAQPPRRDRPRTPRHLRARRHVGIHHTQRHGKSRVGHVLDPSPPRPAAPAPGLPARFASAATSGEPRLRAVSPPEYHHAVTRELLPLTRTARLRRQHA